MFYVAISTFLGIFFAATRRPSQLIMVVIVAGAAQDPLMALTHDTRIQYIDDVPSLILVLSALLFAFGRGRVVETKAVFLYALILVWIAFEYMSSTDHSIALRQARQVALPLGLCVTGYIFFEQIDWAALLRFIRPFGLIVAIWMLAEEYLQRPLLDPVWVYLNATGATLLALRRGLPGSYTADLGASTVFRPGGPFFNPPIAGFALGIAAFAFVVARAGIWKWVGLTVISVAISLSFVRDALVFLLCVTVLYWSSRSAGKVATIVGGSLIGIYLFEQFIGQGNTAAHSNGLLDGIRNAATSLTGQGFGGTGYQARLGGQLNGTVSESLIGLYGAWLGLPFLVLLFWFCRRLLKRYRSTDRHWGGPIFLVIAMLASAAGSESASALASTLPAWVIAGAILRDHDIKMLSGIQESASEADSGLDIRNVVGRPRALEPKS